MKQLIRFFGVLVGGALLIGSAALSPVTQAQNSVAYDTLELVIALDISGSMSSDNVGKDSRGQPRVDVGYSLYPDNVLATDRTGQRFEITSLSLQWVARLLQMQPEVSEAIQVQANVIGFDVKTVPLLDWVDVRTADADGALNIAPPSQDSEAHNSDFITLYSDAAKIFTEHPNERKSRRVLLVVTDSVPCNPANNENPETRYQGDPPKLVYSFDCRTPESMSDHLRFANELLPPDVVPLVVHVSSPSFWEAKTDKEVELSDTRAVWEQITEQNRDGHFEQVENIEALPEVLFDLLAEQLTLTITGGTKTDKANIGRTLGLVEVGGSFEVPPYQEYLEMLIFTESTAEPDIRAKGLPLDTATPIFSSQTGLMRYLRVERPPAGEWEVSSPDGQAISARIIYRPAQASLNWSEKEHWQYQPVQLIYHIHDSHDFPWIEQDYKPNFTVLVHPPEGVPIPLEMSCSSTECASESFLALHDGTYAVDFTVEPGSDWPEIQIPIVDQSEEQAEGATPTARPLEDQYAFLRPAQPGILSVGEVHFWRQIGDKSPASDENPDSSVRFDQTRGESLLVTVWMGKGEDPTQVEMSPNIMAELVYDNGDNGCLPEDKRDAKMMRQEQTLVSRPAVKFEAGVCELSIALYIKGDLKPLAGQDPVKLGETLRLADVHSTSTARLDIALLDEEGASLESINPSSSQETTCETTQPAYEMLDYETMPRFNTTDWVTWETDSKSIEIAFLDENKKAIDPVFVNQTTGAAASIQESPLPFKFTIFRTDSKSVDLATQKEIVLRKSDKAGIYVVELSGLEAGDYCVRFELLVKGAEAPKLDTQYEYVSSLNEGINNPQLVAYLQVKPNKFRLGQIYGAFGLAGVLSLALLRAWVIHYLRTTAPLSGMLAIYAMSNGNSIPEKVWDTPLPTKYNSYKVPRRKLLEPQLALADITDIQVSTQRNRTVAQKGGAHVKIQVHNQKANPNQLQPAEPVYFHTDEQGTHFFVVKFQGDIVDLPVEKFKVG